MLALLFGGSIEEVAIAVPAMKNISTISRHSERERIRNYEFIGALL